MTVKANVVVDTLGLFCPLPVIRTSEAMKALDVGAIVEVISDDPAIELDMPAWCQSHSHTIEEKVVEGGVFRFFVKKQK